MAQENNFIPFFLMRLYMTWELRLDTAATPLLCSTLVGLDKHNAAMFNMPFINMTALFFSKPSGV